MNKSFLTIWRYHIPFTYSHFILFHARNSLGRPTSLIIDFGARATRIIPVVDGFTLNKSIVSTNRGGNWIDVEVKNEIDRSGMEYFIVTEVLRIVEMMHVMLK